jgi:transposase InsO family protein
MLWEWTTTHEDAFLKARKALSEMHDLAFYDQNRPTALHVDASRLFGLGFILKQKDAEGSWRMVQAGSRYLSETESRYAMIELECLGAAWAMQKCRQFIEGLPTFELITDHKPLVPILNDHSLDKLDNPRILRLRLKMQRYQFKARWVPGKENVEADALSRAPVDTASKEDELAEGAASFSAKLALINAISGSDAAVLDPVLERIKMAAQKDKQMIELRETIINGFPNDKCNLSLTLRPFWNIRSQLAIDETDGMIVAGARVVIPAECRQPLLQDLINMHQGATKLRQRARMSVYWPGWRARNAAKTCPSCTEKLPSLPREPLKPHEAATRPFEQLHSDIATVNGRDFLIIADQYSGWPDVIPFPNKNTTARRVVDAVREFFIRGPGAPVKFWSDNGPQFNAVEFKNFAKDWGVSIGNSAPHYPQSNGFAEATIKSMKKLITGSWRNGSFDTNKFAKSILLFRNAPRSGAASPAQMVFNRPVRDALPAHRRSFAPEWQLKADILEKRARRAKEVQIEHYNRTAHPLQPFKIGDHVIVQHPVSKCWATTAIVVEIGPNRDYIVKTPAGRLFRRNRRMLRKRVPVMPGNPPAGPSIQPAPTPPEENQPGSNGTAGTTRRKRGKAKRTPNDTPRRSTRKTKRPTRYTK